MRLYHQQLSIVFILLFICFFPTDIFVFTLYVPLPPLQTCYPVEKCLSSSLISHLFFCFVSFTCSLKISPSSLRRHHMKTPLNFFSSWRCLAFLSTFSIIPEHWNIIFGGLVFPSLYLFTLWNSSIRFFSYSSHYSTH